jgi:hypothetical protein
MLSERRRGRDKGPVGPLQEGRIQQRSFEPTHLLLPVLGVPYDQALLLCGLCGDMRAAAAACNHCMNALVLAISGVRSSHWPDACMRWYWMDCSSVCPQTLPMCVTAQDSLSVMILLQP